MDIQTFFMHWYPLPPASPVEHVNVVEELLAKNKTGEMQFLYLSPSQKVNELIDQIPENRDSSTIKTLLIKHLKETLVAQNPQKFGLQLNETDKDHYFHFGSQFERNQEEDYVKGADSKLPQIKMFHEDISFGDILHVNVWIATKPVRAHPLVFADSNSIEKENIRDSFVPELKSLLSHNEKSTTKYNLVRSMKKGEMLVFFGSEASCSLF
jgi:hypothetical protein